MKRWIAGFVLCAFLGSYAYAGWEIKFKIAESTPNPAVSESKSKPTGTKTKIDGATAPGFKTVTVLIEGPQLKFTSDETPDNFLVVDLEKQSYIVGFVEESEVRGNGSARKSSSKPQKLAVTGTLDEFLSVMDQFIEMVKMFGPSPSVTSKTDVKEKEESTKTDILVKQSTEGKEIAGCKTNAISVTVLETHLPEPKSEKKTEMQATTRFSGQVYLCPEIEITYLIPYLEKIQKKIAEWAKKWAGMFGEMMGLEGGSENTPDLMAAPFKAEQYEEFIAAWKSVKGFPFLGITTMPDQGKVQFEVVSYKSRQIPGSEFSVPKGYKVQTFQEIIGKMMSEMMGGGMGGMAR